MPFMGHHIWCNLDPRIDPEKCRMCKRLKEKYPEDCSPLELIKKHFPNVIPRSGTGSGTEIEDKRSLKTCLGEKKQNG